MLKGKKPETAPFLMEMSGRPSLLSPDGFGLRPHAGKRYKESPILGSGRKENPTMGMKEKENLKV